MTPERLLQLVSHTFHANARILVPAPSAADGPAEHGLHALAARAAAAGALVTLDDVDPDLRAQALAAGWRFAAALPVPRPAALPSAGPRDGAPVLCLAAPDARVLDDAQREILHTYADLVGSLEVTDALRMPLPAADPAADPDSSLTEQLSECLTRVDALLEAGFEGLFVHDGEHCLDINQALCTMLGLEREHVVMQAIDLSDFVTEETYARAEAYMAQQREEPYEGTAVRTDGDTFPVEIRARNIVYAGRPARVVAVRDITVQKASEDALLRTAQRSEVLQEIGRALLTTVDAREVASVVLNRLAALIPHERSSIVAFDTAEGTARVLAVHASSQRWVFAAQGPLHVLPIERFRHGAAVRPGEVQVQPDLTREEAPTAMESLLIRHGLRSLFSVPLFALGRHIGSLNVASCTTDAFTDDHVRLSQEVADLLSVALHRARSEQRRRQAEQASQAAYQRLQLFIEHSPLGYVEFTPDYRIRHWSARAEELLGWTADEMEGRLPDGVDGPLLTVPEDAARIREVMATWDVAAQSGLVVQARNYTSSGAVRHCEWYNSMLLDEDGRPKALFAMVQDVTDRIRYEQGLVRAKEAAEDLARLKSAFLANMSHEIRTPLTSILGFSELLVDHVSDDAAQYLALIRKGGTRLMQTLTSVLDLAQLEAGRTKPSLEPTDAVVEVLDVVQLLAPRAADRGLTLEHDVPDAPVPCHLDRAGFSRILSNLVNNAIKFTEKGTVRVTLRADDEELTVRVRDTGIGIGPDFLPHLFEEFKQESVGVSRTHEGFGLGLTITHRLTVLMGGRIEVESERGVGSCFTVHLPLHPKPPDAD